MELNGRVIRKIQLTDLGNSLYTFFPLHVCTKFIADLYRWALRLLEKTSPRRAPVYKGFSKNVGLDEANQTKRIILPEPFVLRNRQRLFRKRKAPVDLSEHLISPLNRQVLPLTPFSRWRKFIFGLALAAVQSTNDNDNADVNIHSVGNF